MLAECKVYKGIEYVLVDELPENQKGKILLTVSPDLFIKILINGKIVSPCLQYKDYNFWFHHVYKSEVMEQPATERVVAHDLVLVSKA